MSGSAVLDDRPETREIVHVCCHCRRVRTPAGEWECEVPPSDVRLSHGICRACFAAYYPDIPLPPNLR